MPRTRLSQWNSEPHDPRRLGLRGLDLASQADRTLYAEGPSVDVHVAPPQRQHFTGPCPRLGQREKHHEVPSCAVLLCCSKGPGQLLVGHHAVTDTLLSLCLREGAQLNVHLLTRVSAVELQSLDRVFIALVSWQGTTVFVAAMTFHHWAWNKIHLEMHKPEQKVFSTWPVYKFLARYHCLHHRYPDKNFNVVFPLADYVLGTSVRANEGDLKYLQQWGL